MDREILTRSRGKKGPVNIMERNTEENNTDNLPVQQNQRSCDDSLPTFVLGACGGDRETDCEKSDTDENEPRHMRPHNDAGDNTQRHNSEEENLKKLLVKMKHEVSAEISEAIKEAMSTHNTASRDEPVQTDSRVRGDNSGEHNWRTRSRLTNSNRRYRDNSEDQHRLPRHSRSQQRQETFTRVVSSDTDDQEYNASHSVNSFHPQQRNVDQTAAKLPPFTGKEKWTVWINRFSEVARLKGWDNNKKLVEILPRLQGPAGEFVYGQLSHRIRRDFLALVKELNSRFRVIETSKTYGAQFSNRNQRAGERVEEYAADLKRLYDKAHAYRDQRTRQEDLVRRFLDGLCDNETRFHVEYIKEPADIDEAVYEVVNFQETKRRPDVPEHGMEKRNRRPARLVRPYSDSEEEDDEAEREEQGERIARAPPRPKKSQTIKNVPWKNRDSDQAPDTQEKGDNSNNTNSNSEKKIEENSNESLQQLTGALQQLNDRIAKLESNSTTQQQHALPSNSFTSGNKENRSKTTNHMQVQGTQYKTTQKCYNCQEEGHFARECTKPRWGFTYHQGNATRPRTNNYNRNTPNYHQQVRTHQEN